MRKILIMAAATLVVVSAMGCQEQAKPKSASPSVLDVQPTRKLTPTYALTPQQVTPPDEPKAAVDTSPLKTVTPADAGKPIPASAHPAKPAKGTGHSPQANSYKVKKGDTLFHIAKTEYGDGNKWTLIASANPGVSPQSLKAGQTLRLP